MNSDVGCCDWKLDYVLRDLHTHTLLLVICVQCRKFVRSFKLSYYSTVVEILLHFFIKINLPTFISALPSGKTPLLGFSLLEW